MKNTSRSVITSSRSRILLLFVIIGISGCAFISWQTSASENKVAAADDHKPKDGKTFTVEELQVPDPNATPEPKSRTGVPDAGIFIERKLLPSHALGLSEVPPNMVPARNEPEPFLGSPTSDRPSIVTPTTTTFNFTGGLQTFTVPAGVSFINFTALGAQGGSGAVGAGANGGAGGTGSRATGTLAVTPGQVLTVVVGGSGGAPAGGFNGGGPGGSINAGGGGGASDIRFPGASSADRILVAGGGGGGGRGGCEGIVGTAGSGGPGGNGDGNGSNGGDSVTNLGFAGGGSGAVGTAAGNAGIGCAGFLGAAGAAGSGPAGGNGGAGQSCCCFTSNSIPGGGGGGGGFLGGGGGGGGSAGTVGCTGQDKGAGGGGGGGTSYTGGVTAGAITTNIQTGNGQVVFNYNVVTNAPPTITPASVSRQQGSPVSNSTIATVADLDNAAGSLTVTVNGGATATANGVTVSGIVNTAGTVTANVVAACGATTATFTLTVSDGAATTNSTLTVTVSANTPPTVTYNAPSAIAFSQSTTVSPASATDNGSITGYAIQSVVPPLITPPTVNASGVVSISNAEPAGSHVITVRSTDNCGAVTDSAFTLIVNKGNTATAITADTPDPSVIGQNYTVSATVVPQTAGTTGSFPDRLFRDAIPGVCPGKAYPGLLGTPGTYVYNTHRVTNPLPTPVCLTVSITNNAATDQVHIAAFQVPFVAGDIGNAARFLSDSGSSATAGVSVGFAVTIPANSSLDLVAFSPLTSPSGVGLPYTLVVSPGVACNLLGTIGTLPAPSGCTITAGPVPSPVDPDERTAAGPSGLPVNDLEQSRMPVFALNIDSGKDVRATEGQISSSPEAILVAAPTGNISVSDGTNTCVIALPATSCTLPSTSVGAKTLTATYSGDGNFNGSASATVPHTVNKADTTTIVQTAQNAPVYGQSTTITASLVANAPGSGTPQGNVNFLDGATPIAGCQNIALNALGAAACSLNTLGAGTHTINVNYLGNANYNTSNGSAQQTVLKAPLNVLASSHTVTYGDAAPAVTSTITGFVLGETVANLGTQPACSTTYTQGASVSGSQYPTTCSGGVSGNYSFNYINGTVTVNKKGLTVTADPKSRAYGAANPALTATLTGFVGADNAGNSTTGSAGLSTTATATSPVGSYPITATLGTLASTNYSFTNFVGSTLSVTAVQLTVTANNQTRVYGAPNPTLTFSITGFVNGEGVGALAGTPNISTTATATSAPGTYPITAAVGSLASPNYTFTTANGTLTVTQASTTTTITNAAALGNPTSAGQSYAVNWTTSPVAPATGTPTGNVTVTDGTATCTAAVGAGTCNLTSTTSGTKTITATYAGDANFGGSTSQSVQHNVVNGLTGNVKQFIAFGTNTNLAGVTMTLLNTATQQATTTTTDAGGNYSFSTALGQSYTITPSGLGKAFEATSRTYTNVAGNISGADFIAYDVPGPNAIPRSARVSSQIATQGQPVTVPVLITTTGVETRVSFSVEYPTGPLGVPTVSCGTGAVGCTLSVNNSLSGKLGITVTPANSNPLPAGTRELVRVTFPTQANPATSAAIRFGDFPTARDVRNAENNPLPMLYWTDGLVSFTGGTLLDGATISGRVLTAGGQGVRNATVTIIDPVGNRRTAVTGSFGAYTFEGLEIGRDYLLTVTSKRFRFATRTVNLTENLNDVNLIGLE